MTEINFEPFPVLETERLHLRQLTSKDKDEIFAIRSNPEIAKYLDRPLCKATDEALNFIAKVNRGIKHNEWIYWAVSFKNDPGLVGTICLWKISPEQSKAEVGFELLTGYQGKGIMREALSKVLEFGFKKMNLLLIEGEVDPGNKRSINLMKKFNFVKPIRNDDEHVQDPATEIYRLYKVKSAQTAL